MGSVIFDLALSGESCLYETNLYDIDLFQIKRFEVDVLQRDHLIGKKNVWDNIYNPNV